LETVSLALLSILLLLKAAFHAYKPDGGAGTPGGVDLDLGNGGVILVITFMYGNTQFGLLMHNLISLYNKENTKMIQCINVHAFIAGCHILVVNVLWDSIKSLPYPTTANDRTRPGGYIWYFEFAICIAYYVLRMAVKPSKSQKHQ